MIKSIIDELNIENGSNYKLAVLKKHKDNELLQRVMKMTYDRVQFTYGMSIANVAKFEPNAINPYNLVQALDVLEDVICARTITGNAALQHVSNILHSMDESDAEVIKRVLDRDLKINIGKTQINKVWKNLITSPTYMRCDVYGDKTKKNIKFPAIVQLKADGTYREFNVHGDVVEARSRSGESYEYPSLFKSFQGCESGIYQGEITVRLTDDLLEKIAEDIIKADKKNGTNSYEELISAYNEHKEKGVEYILPRSIGNGLLNSDDVPHENLVFDVWDFITHDEYQLAAKKDKKDPCKTLYKDRFEKVKTVISNIENTNIRVIQYKEVKTLSEALTQVSEWMNLGFEGGILKDLNMVFKDGTSKQQLKMKICIDCEMRIVGFKDGSVGTKREGKVGSIEFANDEGTIRGYCSGFSDDFLDEITENKEKYLNKIMTVQFNDLSKARGNDYYALSHPRYIEIRNDKDTTDTLETVLKLREMAIQLQ